MFYRALDFHRVSLTHSLSDRDAERDRTGTKKAKDWDGLEQICKRHPVGTPKVHVWKLVHGQGAIYAEDRLMLQLVYSVAEHCPHWVDASNIRWSISQAQEDCSTVALRSLRYGTTNPRCREGVSPRV